MRTIRHLAGLAARVLQWRPVQVAPVLEAPTSKGLAPGRAMLDNAMPGYRIKNGDAAARREAVAHLRLRLRLASGRVLLPTGRSATWLLPPSQRRRGPAASWPLFAR